MEYKCNICKTQYSSYKSRWLHNYKYHKHVVTKDVTNVTKDVTQLSIFNCKNCNEKFSNRQTKWRHEKSCNLKINIENVNNIEVIKKENEVIKKENEEIKKEMLELKKMLQKALKIHPKTLQKINKQLVNNNSNNTTNNGTINNGPVINNTYVKFGNEQLASLLTHKDMLKIINKQCLCIEESIKTVHFNKSLPEYNNIFITNMKDTIAYIFDGSRFILTSKYEVINNLYNNHLENIEQLNKKFFRIFYLVLG